jgi:hypothetical protein
VPSADATTASEASVVVAAGAAVVVAAGAADVVAAGAAELPLSEPHPDASREKAARTNAKMKQFLFSMNGFPPVRESRLLSSDRH